MANTPTNTKDIGNTAYTVRYGICSAPPNAVTTRVSFSASNKPFASAIQKNMLAMGISWPHNPFMGLRNVWTGLRLRSGALFRGLPAADARRTRDSPLRHERNA